MVAILLVVTSWDTLGNTGKKTGWYLPEVAHPYHVFKKASFDITFCSPKGGKAPMDPGSLDAFKDDEVCKEFLNDKEAQDKISNTIAVDKINPGNFKIVFFAGGHGPMWDFPDNKHLNEISQKVYENGGILSGVCHGVVGLLNVKLSSGEYLINGKELTCFTNSEENAVNLMDVVPFALQTKLEERGARMQVASDWSPFIVTSGRILTGQNPASATGLADDIVKEAKKLQL